ncbi:MAG: FAD-dependent oxidoreductase [Methanosarcinaceae archaeon]|nr:FAD-dependent oxidoreductase [Methanosarcinaceae archaeon]
MKSTEIVIIGLGVGGFIAAKTAKKVNPDAQITIIDEKEYDMFSACGLPFAMEGIVGDFEELKHSLPIEKMNMVKLLNHKVTSIDPENKSVTAVDKDSNETKTIQYDSVIIATGASPFVPPVPGARELLDKGVFVVSDPENSKKVVDYSKGISHAVVVGAGAIGLEVGAAIKANNIDVTLVEMLPHSFPKSIDPDIARILEKGLKKSGMKLMMGASLEKISGDNKVTSVTVNGESLPADIVIMASGVRANWDLAKDAGCKLGNWGIMTNAKMETSIPGIYAIGDCVETVSPINHMPWMSQVSTTAYRQGITAGTNAAGGYDTFGGSLTTFVSVIGNMEVAATGFNQFFSKSAGYELVIGKASGLTRPEWYPGAREITVKILADAKTGKIIGGQAIGEEGAAARVNLVSLAIKAGMNLHDLYSTELAYCPAVAEAYDPLSKACEFAIRKMK